jgi:anti-sigma B factor antagonist
MGTITHADEGNDSHKLALACPAVALSFLGVAQAELTLETRAACTLVRAAGPRLDAAAAPALKNTVVDLANSGQTRVVLSLGAVEQIDSSGLGALIALHKTLAPPTGRLVLCDVPARVASVFQLTRLDRILQQAADVAAAEALVTAP